ncbi:hypothetical protein [Streptomyces ardesiacus]|uniref:hypothetical protein n=1 Tax=Streptomyces ardesiacus TaxID=285564 RepID=UPI003F49E896
MSSSDGPSAADQQLIDHAARHDLTITAKQLAGRRRARLLPGNIPGGGLGQGRGSTSTPPPESFDLVVALGRMSGAASGRRTWRCCCSPKDSRYRRRQSAPRSVPPLTPPLSPMRVTARTTAWTWTSGWTASPTSSPTAPSV